MGKLVRIKIYEPFNGGKQQMKGKYVVERVKPGHNGQDRIVGTDIKIFNGVSEEIPESLANEVIKDLGKEFVEVLGEITYEDEKIPDEVIMEQNDKTTGMKEVKSGLNAAESNRR